METRILIADDNSLFCNQVKEFLEQFSIIKVVDIVHDNKNEIQKIEELMPDIVITDLYRKNGCTGLDVIRRYANQKNAPDFLIISADKKEVIIRENPDIEISGYIEKPFSDFQLIIHELTKIQNRRERKKKNGEILEKFKKENDENRRRVIEYLENSNFDLERYVVQEFLKYPGGIELRDSKNRRIVIYDDFLLRKIQVIYCDIEKKQEDFKFEIEECLWDDYLRQAKLKNQTVTFEQVGEGKVVFNRSKESILGNRKVIRKSEIFSEDNDLYDIYEYLKNEIGVIGKE